MKPTGGSQPRGGFGRELRPAGSMCHIWRVGLRHSRHVPPQLRQRPNKVISLPCQLWAFLHVSPLSSGQPPGNRQ